MIKPIRLLAIIEAATITGPAKNLLQFARLAGSPDYSPPVEVSIAFFQRPGQSNIFLETAQRYSIPIYPIPESGRFDRAVLDGLNALVDRVQPDLIQSHAVKSHFLVRQSGLNRRAGWIAFHHGYTWPDLRARDRRPRSVNAKRSQFVRHAADAKRAAARCGPFRGKDGPR